MILFADTVLVQQVDFLETILEETSDDLQSDSDRSGTTYWLGSDSETESVIHIRAKQRSAGEHFSNPSPFTPFTRSRSIGRSILRNKSRAEDDLVKPHSSPGAKIAGVDIICVAGRSTFSFLSAT